MNDELPERRWDLSAPESQVLLWGPETSDAWALKPALLELVVRRALRLAAVEERRFCFFLKPAVTNILARGPGEVPAASRALGVVIQVRPKSLRAYVGDVHGTPVDRLAHEVFTRHLQRVRIRTGVFRWQRTGGGYVQSEVMPELERRGLYERERAGLFESMRWVLTPEGVAALADLRALLAIGRESFGDWVGRDPARADAYVETAGTSLLLLGGLTPSLLLLKQWALNGGEQAHHRPEAGALCLSALAGPLGPGPFDGLDAASHTIAEGVDRAW
ncbi:MAG: hypothetical protein ACRDJ9_10985, partial [Dehalococcoidia bacterium]